MNVRSTMTTGILLVASAAVAAVLATALAFAQGRPHGSGPREPGLEPGVQRLLGSLNLTADQQTRIDKILASHADISASSRASFMTAHRTLADRIHADTFDEKAIRQAAATLASLEADRAVDEARQFGEIRAVLTPQQLGQLREDLAAREGPTMRERSGS